MVLKGKRLLLLGGSRNMFEVLYAARRQGVFVGVTDWYDKARSPVKTEADASYDISIEDTEALVALIRREGYEGVLTGYTDSYLLPYARLCRKAGLTSYGTDDQMKTLTDKDLYKQLFQKYSVPCLPSYKKEEIGHDFANFPLLIKPSKGSGGKGLIRVADYPTFEKEIDSLEGNALKSAYIIEPFLDERDEMTAFFLMVQGKVLLAGTANRFLSRPQGDKIALPVLYSMPSSYEKVFRDQTAPPIIRMLEALGLQNGILFAQCIVHEGIPKVYDMGYRLTGSLEYKLQEVLYGFNPLDMLIRHSLTGSMLEKNQILDENRLSHPTGFGFNVTLLGTEGRIGTIKGKEEVLALPGVLDFVLKLVEGDGISQDMLGTLGQIVARVFFTSRNLDEAKVQLERIYQFSRILDDQGKDMILDRFEAEQLDFAYA